ncbi:hypothetical protein GNZ12_03175 [Paraburkholderia sp. 1N]|uniref:Uncharacterized protein n=1 Tax=Paraburkholderia solitsugae TaxID=2675748 RepID=A0ABX2BJK1_9BURK|nr:hypothetical protein [Paraburkholderia solitsugae]NPT40330.1 hypothetical protein [Paraburkholderia solitsugae]
MAQLQFGKLFARNRLRSALNSKVDFFSDFPERTDHGTNRLVIVQKKPSIVDNADCDLLVSTQPA